MRYGNPSLEDALGVLLKARVDRLVVFPLYPQYAASSTGSTAQEVLRLLGRRWNVPPLHMVGAFFSAAPFVDAFAENVRETLKTFDAQHVLFSFHGLPERHMRKSDPTGAHCLQAAHCCEKPADASRFCYRAQCYSTARLISERVGLPAARQSVSFQSRLGRTPWIKPYTDVVIPALAQAGVKRLAVACPAFVADCLETLEEIGIRARDSFVAAGGEGLVLVPSLNARPTWAQAVVDLAQDSCGWLKDTGASVDDGR
jgi:ferrochelatase